MLQLIRHITKNPKDKTKLALIFANQTEDDILLRNELEEVAKNHPDQFKLWYTLDRPNEGLLSFFFFYYVNVNSNNFQLCFTDVGWTYSKGFINAEMIKEHLFPPSSDTLIVMCGPPPMIQHACIPSLDSLNYDSKLRFAY